MEEEEGTKEKAGLKVCLQLFEPLLMQSIKSGGSYKCLKI